MEHSIVLRRHGDILGFEYCGSMTTFVLELFKTRNHANKTRVLGQRTYGINSQVTYDQDFPNDIVRASNIDH